MNPEPPTVLKLDSTYSFFLKGTPVFAPLISDKILKQHKNLKRTIFKRKIRKY